MGECADNKSDGSDDKIDDRHCTKDDENGSHRRTESADNKKGDREDRKESDEMEKQANCYFKWIYIENSVYAGKAEAKKHCKGDAGHIQNRYVKSLCEGHGNRSENKDDDREIKARGVEYFIEEPTDFFHFNVL